MSWNQTNHFSSEVLEEFMVEETAGVFSFTGEKELKAPSELKLRRWALLSVRGSMGFLVLSLGFGILCCFSKSTKGSWHGWKLFISLDADVCVSGTWRKLTPSPGRALVGQHCCQGCLWAWLHCCPRWLSNGVLALIPPWWDLWVCWSLGYFSTATTFSVCTFFQSASSLLK